MKNPALSITVFGVYLLVNGLGFVSIPNLLLPVFGFATTTEVWVRILGLLTVILGMYFLYLARPDQRRFMQASVYARLIFFTGVTAFALLKIASPMLVAFGLIDIAGAAWTWLALRATH